MGTIGKAISLSGVTKLPRDDYGFYDRFKQIQERKKTQQPAYDPYKDFVKIDKTLQPAWANELSKLGSETIKKIQDVRAKNPNNQAEIVRIMQEEYNPKASAIISGNTNALDYMAGAISKGYADPEVLRSIATSQNIEDIQKAILAAQDPSVNVSPTGSFFGNAGTRYNIGKDLDFGTEDYNQILPPNQRNLGERTEIISRLGLNPKVKEDRIKQIASNPTFQRKVFYDNPQLRGAINSGQAEQIFIDEATKLLGSVPSEKLGTPTYRENDKPSQPEKVKEEKNKTKVSGNSVQTPNVRWEKYDNPDGDVVLTPKRTNLSNDPEITFTTASINDEGAVTEAKEQSLTGRVSGVIIKPNGRTIIKVTDDKGDTFNVGAASSTTNNLDKVKSVYDFTPQEVNTMIKSGGTLTGDVKNAKKSSAQKHPLPEGKPMRGKKGGIWYIWDENKGKYVQE